MPVLHLPDIPSAESDPAWLLHGENTFSGGKSFSSLEETFPWVSFFLNWWGGGSKTVVHFFVAVRLWNILVCKMPILSLLIWKSKKDNNWPLTSLINGGQCSSRLGEPQNSQSYFWGHSTDWKYHLWNGPKRLESSSLNMIVSSHQPSNKFA